MIVGTYQKSNHLLGNIFGTVYIIQQAEMVIVDLKKIIQKLF